MMTIDDWTMEDAATAGMAGWLIAGGIERVDDMQELRQWSRHRLTQALELHGLPGPATARDHDLTDAVKRLQAVEPDATHSIIRRPAPLAQAA